MINMERGNIMRIRRYIGAILAMSALAAAAVAVTAQDATATTDPAMPTTDPMMTSQPGQSMMGDSAMAPIIDANGTQIGWASFTTSMGMPIGVPMDGSTPVATDTTGTTGGTTMTGTGKVLVTIQLQSATLTPGFHGMHLHTMGNCGDTGEGPFTAAGEHIPPVPQHPNHIGDFPAALVNNDGTAYVSFETDRFTMADLLDADGTAIIIHANPDNYANIPERYGTPDEETLASGDSGPRIACGVLQAGMAPNMSNNGMGTTGTGTTGTGTTGTGTTGDAGTVPTTDPALVPTTDPAMVPTMDPALMPTATAG